MIFGNRCQQAFMLALVGCGTFLLLHPSVEAIELTTLDRSADALQGITPKLPKQPATVILPSAIQVAQYRINRCPPSTNLYRAAVTRHFSVQICAAQGGGNWTYVIFRNGAENIVYLPTMSNSGSVFVAGEGNMRYLLTQKLLRITQNSQIIINEPVLQWQEGTGLSQ